MKPYTVFTGARMLKTWLVCATQNILKSSVSIEGRKIQWEAFLLFLGNTYLPITCVLPTADVFRKSKTQ